MKSIAIGSFVILSLLLLFYMLYPTSVTIGDFPPLPNSVKSSLSGDTVQVPNLSAYFSNNYRGFVIPFYKTSFQDNAKMPFSPLQLNYPPEFAFMAIKDQTQSTYLEELTYPLRESLFINGLEPFDEVTKEKRYSAAKDLVADDGNAYQTKVTLRYYQATDITKFLVWVGINLSFVFIYKIGLQTKKDV